MCIFIQIIFFYLKKKKKLACKYLRLINELCTENISIFVNVIKTVIWLRKERLER